jgi:hypothetical protein
MKKIHAILTIKDLPNMSEQKQLSLLVWLTKITNDLQYDIEDRKHKKYAKTYRLRYIK